ncbi:MAG: type II toxin-antitoxin system RelE/ParE family toxin [Phycisphaerales bacterium JB063]
MNIRFHPEADQEFLDAIDVYESQQPGLGEDFHAEVMATVARITHSPLAWPVLQGDVRRCLSHRFPYGVLYSVESDVIYILAVMHLRRRQGYWKHREEDER